MNSQEIEYTNLEESEDKFAQENLFNLKRRLAYQKAKRLIKRSILYIILIIIAILMFLPLWSGIMSALKTQADLSQTLPFAPPTNLVFDGFIASYNELIRPLINSVLFTSIATILSCLLGSICGFVVAKLKFRGSNTVFLLLTIGIFLPYQSIIIPLFITIRNLGIYDTLWAMVLVHTIYGIPMTTLLFRSYYESVPESLFKAAKVDGAGIMTIYQRIILPLSPLPFVVAGVFQFTSIWNDYLFALTLTATNFTPASFALSNLAGSTEIAWNNVMAGSFIYSLPVIIIFVLLGKYLMQGLMAGAVKG